MNNIATPLSGNTHLQVAASGRGFSPAGSPQAVLRGWRRVLAVVVGTVLGFSLPASAGAKAKQPRCGGGYYAVDGAALLPGASGDDALLIGAGAVGTASGCPTQTPVQFRSVRGGKGGDLLVVRWDVCGATKRVVVRGNVSTDCSTFTGSVKAKGMKRRAFTARTATPPSLADVWDTSPEPMPGAEMVNPAEFLAASKQPGFRIISPRILADDDAAAAAQDEANKKIIDEFIAQHPELADRMSMGVDLDDPDLQPSGDGNYRLTLRDADGNAISDVITQGPRAERAMRAGALRDYPTRENQLRIYEQRYAFASEALGGMPTLEEVAAMTTEEITAWNEYTNGQYPNTQAVAPLPGEEVSASYPAHCGNEIGYGDGTDGSSSGTCSHSFAGLYYTVSWPNKYFDTCIKNQANRGSCVAFAITAGRELQLAKQFDRWVNLSEQALYYAAKTTYQPTMYGDGLDGSSLAQQLLDTNYQQPLESTWDYNPSNSRTANDKTSTYMNSCTNYNGDERAFCSDSAGQGRIQCMQAGPLTVCAITGAPVSGITVRSRNAPAALWNSSNPSESLQNVEYAIYGNRTPVVMGIPVVESFDAVNKDGFVSYDSNRVKVCATDPAKNACIKKDDCQCSRGGHAVLAVGIIYNGKLPETTPKGAGGGYMIVKNSWGCVGDGGYYYLPLAWVMKFAYEARPVGEVDTSSPLPDQPFDTYQFDFKPVPPAIHVVQPLVSESYVEGQQVPLVADGADFQYDQYALLGQTTWVSNLQGQIGTGTSTLTTLVQGTHNITVSYTGKLGVTVTATTRVYVGPRPVDLPPTPYFFGYTLGSGNQCPTYCSYNCVLTTGYGQDNEDGLLNGTSQVRWYLGFPSGGRNLVASGGTAGGGSKFLGCIRPCGGTFTFTLEVADSGGNVTETRRTLGTASCVN